MTSRDFLFAVIALASSPVIANEEQSSIEVCREAFRLAAEK